MRKFMLSFAQSLTTSYSNEWICTDLKLHLVLHKRNSPFIGNNQALVVLFFIYRSKNQNLEQYKHRTMLHNYTVQYADIWGKCSSRLPEFSKSYSSTEKLLKEKSLDQFLQSIKSFRKRRISKNGLTEKEHQLFFTNTRGFLRDGMDFTDHQLEMMFSDEMIGLTKTFILESREFDAALTYSEIFQACRNVWIMNGLQLIMGLPMKLTPSIFAYSLLYPYTDNMIDDPLISNIDKMIFSERFRLRLSGQFLKPKDRTESAIYRLVEMIETEYPRIDFPEVYESLLGIHEAQTNSVKLIKRNNLLSEIDTLKICLTKGGASVLADGYLVAGKLTETQRYFLFGYGAYLQLLDDIQDIEEDYRDGLMTVFSGSAFQSPLDEKLNKTYWFGEEVMKSLDYFDGQHLDLFKSLMRKSMDLYISEAIAQTPEAYSTKYVSDFESWSPFHFSYIRKQKKEFTPYNGFLLTAIEEIAFTENMIFA